MARYHSVARTEVEGLLGQPYAYLLAKGFNV